MLHVAALPFATPQGTQALLHAMLEALAQHGHDVHLLCYGHGEPRAGSYSVHRARAGSRRTLRSGPALEKLALDLDLARRLRALERELRPDVVIAHHVEAAACALLARQRAWFFAHTSLEAELPSYFARAWARPLAALGARIDARLVESARGVLAVSPALATVLQQKFHCMSAAIPPPWPLPPAIGAVERREARASLGIGEEREVALYAGNLDTYQGLEPLYAALRSVQAARPRFLPLFATAVERARALSALRRAGLERRALVAPLHDEAQRRVVHAAADVTLVPRGAPGGVPIKLFEALARGVPVIAARRALAGYPLDDVCDPIDGDDATAWAAALARHFAAKGGAESRALRARERIAERFTPAQFVASFERALRGAPAP